MCRAFPCAATRLRGIENCDRRLIFGADYISYRQKPCEGRRPLNFSRCFLRSNKILLEQCEILRHAPQIRGVGLTYDSQCCATQRKRAQFVSLELEIRSSIQSNYGRKIGTDIYRVSRQAEGYPSRAKRRLTAQQPCLSRSSRLATVPLRRACRPS